MMLQNKLDAFREDFEQGRLPLVPTQAQLDTMERSIQSLKDSGQADRALGVGATSPTPSARSA